METIFWICWIAELMVVIWWIYTDSKLEHIRPNPVSYLCFLYLVAVLVIRFGLHAKGFSNVMVLIPAIPLVGMLIIIVATVLSGKKWN